MIGISRERLPVRNGTVAAGRVRAAAARSIKKALACTHVLDLVNALTRRDRVAIMLYHGFREDRDERFGNLLPASIFEQHIRMYTRYGIPRSLEQVRDGARSGIVVTMDDGYANNFELAFPILRKYGFPATIFVTTGFVDRTAPLWGDWLDFLITSARRSDSILDWNGRAIPLTLAGPGAAARAGRDLRRLLRALPPDDIRTFLYRLEEHLGIRYGWDDVPNQLRPLCWSEVRAMRRSGLVSFGAHTETHPVLSQCSAERQWSEIAGSKRRLEEELGESCYAFAYPYGKPGDYSPATRRIVEEAGYSIAMTTESGFNRASGRDRFGLKRWGAPARGEDLGFLVSGAPLFTQYFRNVSRP